MYEILRDLQAGELVLDLGSKSGSFDAARCQGKTVRVDLNPPAPDRSANWVRADAASLPFRDGCFSAVISNHSLEHFLCLDAALSEVGRVLNDGGALFVAVPDAASLTDRIYRWLGRGGGHVNGFTSAQGVIDLVRARTGLNYAGGRVLCTSLSFLNAHNHLAPAPRRLLLLGGGREDILRWVNGLLRAADRLLGTRTCLYGWALYFGVLREPVNPRTWVNVCVRCGSGHDSNALLGAGLVRRRFLLPPFYVCPSCGARNVFFRDEAFALLR